MRKLTEFCRINSLYELLEAVNLRHGCMLIADEPGTILLRWKLELREICSVNHVHVNHGELVDVI
jgi:hypothetical protein